MSEPFHSDVPWLIVSLEGVVAAAIPEVRVEAMAEAARIDANDAYQRLWASGFSARCCLGEFNLAEMITEIRERLGVDLTEAHLMGLWSLAYEPDLDAIAELTAASGFRVGLIADEAPLFRAAFEAYLPEVELLADCSWFSYEHDASIDDERFYRSVAAALELGEQKPTLLAATASQRQAAAAAGWHIASDVRAALAGHDSGEGSR